MNNYQTPADGRLFVPSDDVGNPKTEEIVASMQELLQGEEIVSSENARVYVDEFYYTDGGISLSVIFGDWFVSLQIPLQPKKELLSNLSQINEAFGVASRQSGYFLSNADIEFVETFTPDAQGRVTLGRQYAGRNVRLVGSVVDDE